MDGTCEVILEMDLEILYSKCSICFDNSLDFSIRSCRDQFCHECFTQYIAGIVDNSWGMSGILAINQVQPITCPVCRIVIPLNEWSQYVLDETLLLKYNRLNQPFRPISRSCPCSNSVCFSQAPVQRTSHPQYIAFNSVFLPKSARSLNRLSFLIDILQVLLSASLHNLKVIRAVISLAIISI